MTSSARLRGAGLQRASERLSDRDWALIRDVARFRLMTGRQLQQLHVGPSETDARTTRRLLARLISERILARLPRQVGGLHAGSSGQVLALGPVGDRLLNDGQPRRRARDVSDGFLDHTLAVADLYVSLRSAEQRGDLTLRRVDSEPQCWRRLDAHGAGDWLKPDLHVVLTTGHEQLHSYVELDRGTEHRPALLRKLRLYEDAYRSGSASDPGDVFPRVVWLVPSEPRAALVRQLVARTAGLTPELHAVGLHAEALSLLKGGGPGS